MKTDPSFQPALIRSPAKKLTIGRVLLALLLGASTWAALSWYLSPGPLYTLRFPDTGLIEQPFPGPTYHFLVGVDAQGRLHLERPNVPGPGRLQVECYDLASGRLLTSETHDAAKYLDKFEAAWWGFGVNHHVYVLPPIESTSPRADRELFPISGSDQVVRVAPAPVSMGEFLDDLLRRVPGTAEWLNPDRHEAGVWDQARGRFLWSVPVFFRLDWITQVFDTTEGDYLVVEQRRQGRLLVSVLKLPLLTYSPWWSRSAGLLVVGLVLLLPKLRRLPHRQ